MFNLGLLVFFQVVLESLPVSSSGHIALLERALIALGSLKNQIGISCYKHLELFLHLPSALVFFVFLIFFSRKCWPLLRTTPVAYLLFVFVADLITMVFYFSGFFKDAIPLPLGFMITCLAVLLSVVITFKEDNVLSLKKTVILGFAQGMSLMPGISRLASTYLFGRVVGLSKNCSLFVSLSLAVPLFIGGGLKGLYNVMSYKECYGHILNFNFIILILLASLLAFLLLVCLKWLIKYDKYWIFSIYLIVPVLLSLFI